MRQSVVLIGVCAVVLVGAWLASRALSSTDVSPGVAQPTASPAVAGDSNAQLNQQLVPAPIAPTPAQPAPPTRERPETRALIDSARSGKMEEPVKAMPMQAVDPAPDEEVNPYVGESRELDYADKLMWESDGGVERLQSARDVFQRCLDSVPNSERCRDGLKAVEAKLNPPKAMVMPKPLPTLKNDAQDPSKVLPRAKP